MQNTPYTPLATPEGVNAISTAPDASGLRIGVVLSRFNPQIGEALLAAACAELARLGMDIKDSKRLQLMSVPGALEIPLALKLIAQTAPPVSALIALGTVIRGETYHFEVVANEASRGVSQVQLECGVPIANGILTVDTLAQAERRAAQKGTDCARTAVEMACLRHATVSAR